MGILNDSYRHVMGLSDPRRAVEHKVNAQVDNGDGTFSLPRPLEFSVSDWDAEPGRVWLRTRYEPIEIIFPPALCAEAGQPVIIEETSHEHD